MNRLNAWPARGAPEVAAVTTSGPDADAAAIYEQAGVAIEIVKFPDLGTATMTDDEVDYCFAAAKQLGARAITCEPPLSQTKRVGRFADKHQMVVAYHDHANISSVEAFGRTGAWEQAFFYSKTTGPTSTSVTLPPATANRRSTSCASIMTALRTST